MTGGTATPAAQAGSIDGRAAIWRHPFDARVIATVIGVLYLALPLPLFFWGWFKPAVAVPLIAALALLCAMTVIRLSRSWLAAAPDRDSVSPAQVVLLLLAWTAVLIPFGVGGILHETSDWVKHNTVFQLLIREPWPPSITTDIQTFGLSYYIAWFLPAALVGKAVGWASANLTLLVMSSIGLSALTVLASRLTGAGLRLTFLLCLAFAGLDVLGNFIIEQTTSLASTDSQFVKGEEIWSGAFLLTGHITLLYYVPNQAIAGWLMTAMLVAGIRYGAPVPLFFFCAAMSPLWAPWLTIGLIPIGLYFSARHMIRAPERSFGALIRGFREDADIYLPAVAVALALVVFYSTRFAVTAGDFVPPPRGYLELTPSATYFSGLRLVFIYVVFVAMELGGIAVLLWWALRDFKCGLAWELLAVSLLFLFALPWVRYGFFNDFATRSSIPAMYVLILLAGFCLARDMPKVKRAALVGFLILCTANALWINKREFQKNFTSDWNFLMLQKPEEVLSFQCLHETRSRQIRLNYLRQYVGKPDWAIHRLIMKPLHPATGGGEFHVPAGSSAEERIAAACGEAKG